MHFIPSKLTVVARVLVLLFAWTSGLVAFGQVRGSVETFENEANALSWDTYDFADGMSYAPGWDLFGAGDADAFTIVAPGSGVSIFADGNSSGGDLVGDFSGNHIEGMGCEAFVEDASGLEYAEFYFVSGGVFYFSIEFSDADFAGSDGWAFIGVDFKADFWYLLEDEGFVEVDLTDEILASVTEVGVDFFANDSRTESMLVAIDDFYLLPETILPELAVDKNGSDFELSFMREVSQEYTVHKSTDLEMWSVLPGNSKVTGNTIYTVSDPMVVKKFYRVETDFFFTIIPDVGPP